MTAIEAGPLAAETMQPEKKWRRLSLWAIVLLLPAVIAEVSYQPAKALLDGNDVVARDVAAGAETRFGGSDWRLDAMLTTDAGADKLPANAAPVFVDFVVRVGDPDLEKLWLGCRIRLVDAGGRSWSPTYVNVLPSSDDLKACISAAYSGAKAGDTLKIRETFLVPKDALGSVRPTVGVSSERPYYLRFERPAG
jgi:hypothetical protein